MTDAGRFDVQRLRLRDYRSVADCDIRLGPFAVLVGPNGSGKSNVVDALAFVAQALGENLDNAVRDRGGAGEVLRRSQRGAGRFDIGLDIAAGSMSATYGFSVDTDGEGGYRVAREHCRIERQNGERVLVEVRDGVVVDSTTGPLPRAATDRLFLVALSGLPEFRPLFDGLAGLRVHRLDPEAMRRPRAASPGENLAADGANIAAAVDHLSRLHPERLDRVVEYLRRIVPGIESVATQSAASWQSLVFTQNNDGGPGSWTFPASSMSDGTLCALGVLVALNADTASPVVIEEPETALHPAAAGLLLEALRGASERRQVLVTSHSPDLLDADLAADEVVVVRSDRGATRVGRPDAAARSVLREGLYTAGELLRADQLLPALDPEAETDAPEALLS